MPIRQRAKRDGSSLPDHSPLVWLGAGGGGAPQLRTPISVPTKPRVIATSTTMAILRPPPRLVGAGREGGRIAGSALGVHAGADDDCGIAWLGGSAIVGGSAAAS